MSSLWFLTVELNWPQPHPAGAKARRQFAPLAARLKPCPCYKTLDAGRNAKAGSGGRSGPFEGPYNKASGFAGGYLLCCICGPTKVVPFCKTLLAPGFSASCSAPARCVLGGFRKLLSLATSCALLSAGALLSFGQAPAPSAKVLAQRVDHHYNSLHSLKAGFTESYEGLGMSRTESGTLLLLKPGRMKWDYSSPPGKIFLLDGKYAWLYTPGDAHVQRIAAKDLDDLRSPLRYLLGHAELAKELNGLAVKPAPNGQFTLTGIPKNMESRVARLALTVTAEGTITGIEIVETDGAVTRFTFSHEQPDAPLSANTFRFRAPPGVPVVDSLPPV